MHRLTRTFCLTVVSCLSLLPGDSVSALEDVPGPTLVDLIERADKVKVPGGAGWETLMAQTKVLKNAATLACTTKDQEALERADKALANMVDRAREEDDDYTRDNLLACRSEVLAALGRWEQARGLAWEIPSQEVRASAYASIAIQRALAGDREQYKKELDEALKLLQQINQIDNRRDAEEREFTEYYAASILQSLIDSLVLSDAQPKDASIAELNRLAAMFEKLELSEPARAEVHCILAYGYCRLELREEARPWIKRVEPALIKERKKMDELGPDDDWMTYGVDYTYYRMAVVYTILGDDEAAAAAVSKIAEQATRQMASAYQAPCFAKRGEVQKAAEHLATIVDYALKAHDIVNQGGPGRDDEQWDDYSANDVFWDLYVAAEVAVNLGDDAQLKRLRDGVDKPVYAIAIDSGEAYARRNPFSK